MTIAWYFWPSLLLAIDIVIAYAVNLGRWTIRGDNKLQGWAPMYIALAIVQLLIVAYYGGVTW